MRGHDRALFVRYGKTYHRKQVRAADKADVVRIIAEDKRGALLVPGANLPPLP